MRTKVIRIEKPKGGNMSYDIDCFNWLEEKMEWWRIEKESSNLYRLIAKPVNNGKDIWVVEKESFQDLLDVIDEAFIRQVAWTE